MAKHNKTHLKNIPHKKVIVPVQEEITTSSPTIHPNATLTPEASFENSTSQWLSKDSTNAPKIGEVSEEEKPYAESHAALIDKYILSKQSLPFAIILVIIGVIFVQDNYNEKLSSWEGIWWAITKSIILILMVFGVLFCQFLYKKISGYK